MSYLKHLESAAALTNTIALHRDDAVKAIERLKYQGGHSGNGVDFSNVQAAMRAVIMAAQQITDEVAKAQSGNVIEHAKEGAPGTPSTVCRLPVRPHVIATGRPPVRDYPDQQAVQPVSTNPRFSTARGWLAISMAGTVLAFCAFLALT